MQYKIGGLMIIEIPKTVYKRFVKSFPELYPEIKLKLISCDETLEKLGFCEDAPCAVRFDLGNKDIEEVLDELM